MSTPSRRSGLAIAYRRLRTPVSPVRSSDPSTARPRIPAVISLVSGVFASIIAIASLAGASTDGALLGVGVVATVVAAVAFLIARAGFRLATPVAGRESRIGVLMLLVALALFVGVIGSMVAFVISAAMVSQYGAGAAIILLVSSGVVMVAGARVLGIAAARKRAREGR
ncbi:hypothetical protein RN51_02479 [Microbacterium oxydans]|uniref:Uncharacterized protein n=1 Tax=Microbacterium oxydans TaxID=82380 RepID=A0A0F0KKR5_9MICO|nr:hypothetical protein [Microbacterium oxydans]KJL21458.1 hypothetical protein RN51_02479 [Microbacterium oxydans]